MSIESINLRKCIIMELSTNSKSFLVKDLYDNSEKIVLLSGNQRMFYLHYLVGHVVYVAISSDNEWRLVTETDFKMNDFLYKKKIQIDEYFDT